MSEYYGRMNKKVRKLQGRIASIWRMAEELRKTHAYVLDRLRQDVWETEQFANLPRWASSRVQGYAEAMFDNVWSKVIWVLPAPAAVDNEWQHGQWVWTRHPDAVYNYRWAQDRDGAHVWREQWEKGEVAFFTLPDDEQEV